MRQLPKYIICAIAGILAIASCQREKEWQEQTEEKIPLFLSGDIEQQAVTRASDNGFANGDQVGIWAVNYDGDTPGTLALRGNQATNVRFTYNGTSWTSDYDIYYKDKYTKVDLYGVYPYSSAISSIEDMLFEVQEDQSTVSAHGIMGGYEASDFLWAKREAVNPTPNAVQLLFQHKMSCVVVTLVKGTGFAGGEFEGLSQSVLINNVKRNATINLATGVVTATGAIPSRSTVPAAYEGGFRAIVVPQTVSSANSLFSITLGGVPYTYSEGAAFTYVAGKQHNFAVTVDKKADGGYAVTVNTTVSAWTNDNSSHEFVAKEYVVVNVETPGTLGETLVNAGKNPDAIKYLKVLGTVNDSDFNFMRHHMAVLQGINMQETVVEGGRIPDNAFNHKTTLTSFIFPDGKHNNSLTIINGFHGTSLSGTLVIPEGVEEVYGFDETNINSIVFPSSLRIIGDSCFSNCQSLTNPLQLPDNLREIGDYAFTDCRSLSGELILPSELETIGNYAFYYCNSLTGSLIIPNKVTEINDFSFFYCRNLNGKLVLPDGLIRIGSSAFYECKFKGELLLPNSLISIGSDAFWFNLFSGTLVLPDNLQSLSNGVFLGCSRLQGTLVLPEEITSLPSGVFQQCSQLEGVVLNSNLSSIGANCFKGCFQISSIVSYAEQPPLLGTGVFDGVAKDNFAVEVPESSVSDYSYATGWHEFKRIAAHREFTVSRRSFKSLNKGDSREFVVRALSGADWHVESKPEWITVSPSSGTGKTDVTVTFSDLAANADDREGEVVFLLDGKDYRSTMAVAQYDYTYGDGDVVTHQTHSVGAGVPIVFLGDCYDAADIANNSYLSDTQAAIGHFFDIEPYKTYKNYFDVYIVFGKSEDSGVGTVNTIREAKFGTQYSLTGGALENNGTVAFQYAKKADANMDLTKSLVVMILNSTEYGGVTYMWGDGSAIAICPKSTDPYPYDFRGLVQHEAGGHGFGKLADEYIYTNAFIQACGCLNPHLKEFLAGKAYGWYKNLSETSDRDMVPWSHLMYHPSYANTVDIYEGGYFHTRGMFRSESTSCMNNNIPYYSAISRQAIVERIMAYSGGTFTLEDFYANDVAALPTKSSIGAMPSWSPSNSTNAKHHEPVIMGEHPNL